MAGLGCAAEYAAYIADRGGAILTQAQVITKVDWSRVLNDASTASLTIEPDVDCCGVLGDMRAMRHWVHIYRNGSYVWGGQILIPKWGAGTVQISAADIVSVLNRRTPHESTTFTNTDLTDIAQWLIEDGFAPDDPGHSVTVLAQSGVIGSRDYQENIGQTGDYLRNLAETGLDFTAVGETLLLMPDDWSASVGLITDVDLPDGLSVEEDGTAMATKWAVYGDTGSGIVGVAGGVHPYYGLIERSIQDTSIKDQVSADAAAQSRLNASLPVPVYIDSSEVTLSPDTGVDIARLVPGWCVDVATTATCRNISQRMKITGVSVSADGDGESVKVQFGPVSSSEDN
ncbi:hypothetical protein [Streptomyces prunicolor]|uniref:hypothetical protein n=1 Tax=Streptomyces prunicolor TaxID=67348 RepID=UPI000372B958|nr:hypothetical protein [Streptomyces prunicolor]